MSDLTDAQFAAYVDRILECRKAEDEAKEDTKQAYADLKDAGGDKTEAGLLVRVLRMDEKDAGKAKAREEMLEEARLRYRRGKASHVRAREASQSYAEAKGVEPNRMDGFVAIPFHPKPFTDTQEQPEEPASQSEPVIPGPSSLAARDADESAAPIPHSAVTPPAADKTGAAPLPSSAVPVTPFDNPRCLNACHLAHSKDACHDCLIAWSARPKDEQVRLWAEANAAMAGA